MSHTIEMKHKEYAIQPHKLVLAECRVNEDTGVLTKIKGYKDRTVKETSDIRLHPNNLKRDVGFTLCVNPGTLPPP
jgi:hypothetical protein